MACNWISFETDSIGIASEVLVKVRQTAMSSVSPPESFAASNAVQVIQSELSKDVSGTYLLVDENVVRGYAIATVSEDPIWGRSGWLNPGAFAIQPGYEYALPELYMIIGQEWLDRGILDHHLFLFTPDRVLPPIWTDLGFAKQQTHAMLNLD